MQIGKKIKQLREQKALTQKELTARAGDLSASYIANLENGTIKRPGGAKLTMIARALDVTLDELLSGTDAKAAVDEETREKARSWCLNQLCPKAVVDTEPAEAPRDLSGHCSEKRYSYIYQWTEKGVWYGVKSFASFPAFNQNGEPMNYCPFCGKLLLDKCRACERAIESSEQQYCTGCGSDLHHEWEIQDDIDRDMSPDRI